MLSLIFIVFAILAYCGASIMMTVINKWVVSGQAFNMNFLLLAIQSIVSVLAVFTAKRAGVITFRDWDTNDAKIWFPISALLVTVIYTGSKSLVRSVCLVVPGCIGSRLTLRRLVQIAIPHHSFVHCPQERSYHLNRGLPSHSLPNASSPSLLTYDIIAPSNRLTERSSGSEDTSPAWLSPRSCSW
jgi:hypothetical protein